LRTGRRWSFFRRCGLCEALTSLFLALYGAISDALFEAEVFFFSGSTWVSFFFSRSPNTLARPLFPQDPPREALSPTPVWGATIWFLSLGRGLLFSNPCARGLLCSTPRFFLSHYAISFHRLFSLRASWLIFARRKLLFIFF